MPAVVVAVSTQRPSLARQRRTARARNRGSNAKLLQQLAMECLAVSSFSSCDRTCDLPQHLACSLVPRPSAFNNHGLETNALLSPHSSCLQVFSCTAWYRWLRSPPAQHGVAWCGNRSSTALHNGHQVSSAAAGTPKPCRSSATNRAGSRRQLPLGKAARKARAPTSASDKSRARAVGVLLANCARQPVVSTSSVS